MNQLLGLFVASCAALLSPDLGWRKVELVQVDFKVELVNELFAARPHIAILGDPPRPHSGGYNERRAGTKWVPRRGTLIESLTPAIGANAAEALADVVLKRLLGFSETSYNRVTIQLNRKVSDRHFTLIVEDLGKR